MESALNDSVLSLLEEHCGLGSNSKKVLRSRGKKIVPGTKVVSLARNGKASSSTSASTPATSASNDAEWICAKCSAPWQDDGDDKWIVCDRCDKPYHLQCCGIQYRRQDYYTVDIEHMPFTCDAC